MAFGLLQNLKKVFTRQKSDSTNSPQAGRRLLFTFLPTAALGFVIGEKAQAATWKKIASGTVLTPPSSTALLKGNSGGQLADAVAGSDYAKPDTAADWTGRQTLKGSASNVAALLTNAAEVTTVSATAASSTVTFYAATQSVLYYTTAASGHWTINLTLSSGTTFNTALSNGQCVTVAFLVTQGTNAYYNNAVQVDGAAVTAKWQGGTAPTSGNASSIDVYTYTVIKTANATFTVLASQTKFA